MAIFTVILNYRGGTYISQVAAGNARTALVKWAKQIKPKDIQQLGPRRLELLITDIESTWADLYKPTPIQGLSNVWCAGSPLPGGLVNIVRTEITS